LLSILGIAKAQQGNHLVVQGYEELYNTIIEPYSEAVKKTTYYDIDFNSPDITVNKINSNRITYNLYDTTVPPLNVFQWKLAQGYHTVSNGKGNLMAFVFNNVLYNKNGDSIDYLSQYGGRRGVASWVGASDTFTLYYIGTPSIHNASTFEKQFHRANYLVQLPIFL
jgi:hypothetical protein